jgi:hypothetical protein
MAHHSALQSWRTALATGVASAALCAYGVRPARAQTVPPAPPCNQISGTTGSIVTCSGNVSSGVSLPNGSGPFDTLNIGNLTANIAPASGVTGVEFTSNGNVTLNVDPRPFSIVTTDAKWHLCRFQWRLCHDHVDRRHHDLRWEQYRHSRLGAVERVDDHVQRQDLDQRQQCLRHCCGQRLRTHNHHLDRRHQDQRHLCRGHQRRQHRHARHDGRGHCDHVIRQHHDLGQQCHRH